MMLTRLAKTAADAVVSVLLAPTCASCNAILDTPLDGCVCRNCWTSILPILPPVCEVCGDPLSKADVCARCQSHPRLVSRARAIGDYDGTLRLIIHAMKYQHRHSIAAGLAALMREHGQDVLEGAAFVVPVPLHRRRQRVRGFNQARELARYLGLPVVQPIVRMRHTPSQIDLPADLRRANVHGAFGRRRDILRTMPKLQGARVVLIDDVSTTGSTLEACAAVLKEAGVEEVFALTAARVVTRTSGV